MTEPHPPKAQPPARRQPPRSARRRSRELALQGLYQWLVAKADAAEIETHMREQADYARCDGAHFDALLRGCIAQSATLDGLLARHLDRPAAHLSPIEHAVLLIGTYELTHCLDVPYRVAINEAVEVAKQFGGTDGHKYVNGVLDKAAADLRPAEVAAARPSRRSGPAAT